MRKLTLSADSDIIDKAKELARQRGISVSAMFSRYIEGMTSPRQSRRELPPITRRSQGMVKTSSTKSYREMYEAALLRKSRK